MDNLITLAIFKFCLGGFTFFHFIYTFVMFYIQYKESLKHKSHIKLMEKVYNNKEIEFIDPLKLKEEEFIESLNIDEEKYQEDEEYAHSIERMKYLYKEGKDLGISSKMVYGSGIFGLGLFYTFIVIKFACSLIG